MIIDLGPLTIKFDVLLVQIVNIAILFFLFQKLFGDTLVKEIQKRRDMTLKLEQADVEYDAMLKKAEEEKKQLLQEALDHKNNLILEGKNLAKRESKKILDNALLQADLILSKASKAISLEKKTIKEKFEISVKSVATTMLQKMFQSNEKISQEYVKTLVEEFNVSTK